MNAAAFETFPIAPTTPIKDECVWFRSEGPFVNTLNIVVHNARNKSALNDAIGVVYMPKDGSAPHAAIYAGSARKPKDIANAGNGLSVEELMKWVEDTLSVESRKLA